jgi:hypothetical protein
MAQLVSLGLVAVVTRRCHHAVGALVQQRRHSRRQLTDGPNVAATA